MPEWIDTKQAAQISGYTTRFVCRLVRDKQVDGERRGKAYWINKESLLTYIESTTKANPNLAPTIEPKTTKPFPPRVERLLRILAEIERQDIAKAKAKAAEDNQQN